MIRHGGLSVGVGQAGIDLRHGDRAGAAVEHEPVLRAGQSEAVAAGEAAQTQRLIALALGIRLVGDAVPDVTVVAGLALPAISTFLPFS